MPPSRDVELRILNQHISDSAPSVEIAAQHLTYRWCPLIAALR